MCSRTSYYLNQFWNQVVLHTHTSRNCTYFLLSLLILSALNQIKEKRSKWPEYNSPYSETNISRFQCDLFFLAHALFVQKTLMFLSSDFLLLSFFAELCWFFILLLTAGEEVSLKHTRWPSTWPALTPHLSCWCKHKMHWFFQTRWNTAFIKSYYTAANTKPQNELIIPPVCFIM